MKNLLDYKDYIKKINEGLIKTSDLTKSVNVISNKLKNLVIIHNINYYKKTRDFKVELETKKLTQDDWLELIKDLSILINNLGYFPSVIELRKKKSLWAKLTFKDYVIIRNENDHFNDIIIKNFDYVSIVYESKYDKEVNNLPNEIYHAYNSYYEDKINSFWMNSFLIITFRY